MWKKGASIISSDHDRHLRRSRGVVAPLSGILLWCRQNQDILRRSQNGSASLDVLDFGWYASWLCDRSVVYSDFLAMAKLVVCFELPYTRGRTKSMLAWQRNRCSYACSDLTLRW